MHKYFVAALLTVFISSTAQAQVLFTYGRDSITVPEFLKAYRKNNSAASKDNNDINSYLDLYISSRLKIREAKSLGYDTLPQIVSDLRDLREQIIPTYLNDEQGVKKLVDEAFARSQKDIHLAHLFISYTKTGLYDSLNAEKRAADVYARLAKGESFAKLAAEFSDDPSARDNGGDAGWITAFTLPYALENLAYNTKVGKISPLYRSKAGIHIFKNLGERPNPGTVKAAQILLAFPPNATPAVKASVKKLADSLYNRVIKGDDFGRLAENFSNDVVSAASRGMIAEFGTGQYDPAFEAVAFSLQKDGAVSKPFLTSHGWHIVKRISRHPVNKDPDNAIAMEALREKVTTGDRIETTRSAMVKKISQQLGFNMIHTNFNSLWAFTDSVLIQKNPASPSGMNVSTPLFTTGDKTVTAGHWMDYGRAFRYKQDGTGIKTNQALWNEFLEQSILNYYKDNLEKYNPEFKNQLEEFKDGNLFFEIMQRKVWGPAQADTAALEAYYKTNRSKYQWKKSADAIIFYSGDAGVVTKALKELQKDPRAWKTVLAKYEETLAADSNRFEQDQIPGTKNTTLKAGTFTSIEKNETDKTTAFAYIIKRYPNPEPRNFADAKGLVISDYQSELEQKWVNELRAKYPVTVNQAALTELNKTK